MMFNSVHLLVVFVKKDFETRMRLSSMLVVPWLLLALLEVLCKLTMLFLQLRERERKEHWMTDSLFQIC